MTRQLPEVVTLVVRHRVRTTQLGAYEVWLRQIMNVAKQFEGHLGVNVMRTRSAGLTNFTIVLRYSCIQRLQAWLDSVDRKKLIKEVLPLLVDGDQTEVSKANEFWFSPVSEHAEPPRWKLACVIFLVIFPLSLLVPLALRPVFMNIPWLGGYFASSLLITATIVLLMVYILMPWVTGFFGDWLQGDDDGAAS